MFRTDVCKRMIALACMLSATVLPVLYSADAKSDFVDPPLQFRSRPLWFWNDAAATAAEVEAQLQGNRDRSGYGGLAAPAARRSRTIRTTSRP